MCELLCRLTHKNSEWAWTHGQEDAFSKAPVLKYFSKSDPTKDQGDTSKDGLGFVLIQLDQPKAFARRALSLAERKYSQIEKELLAKAFGMEHNHHYMYG